MIQIHSKMSKIFSLWLSTLTFYAHAQEPKIVLSILAPLGVLDSYVVRQFEVKNKVSIRTELIAGNNEFQLKLKASPQLWDVVIADENVLTKLSLAKFLRPHEIQLQTPLPDLDQPAKINPEGRAYLHLMADPLGMVWKQGSVTSKTLPSWAWLAEVEKNPLWRNGVVLPYDLGIQYLVAQLATKSDAADTNLKPTHQKALSWLKLARSQARNDQALLEINFLSDQAIAGFLWRSDYLRIRKFARNLEFVVPEQGTYFNRIGVGMATATQHVALARQFMLFLKEQQTILAKYSGLTPIETRVSNWKLFENERYLERNLNQNLEKMLGLAVKSK